MHENGIAVICPTYNCTTYIRRTLDTILEQFDYPEEVIFSDDGSVDSTIEIIEQNRHRFSQAGIVLQVLKNKHEGPGAARNYGITATNQPWVAFLDADDTWKPEKLKRIRQTLKNNSEVNCILHWEEYFRSDGRIVVLDHGKNCNQKYTLSEQLYRNNFMSTSAVVCQRKLLQESGYFDSTLPNGQDYELWLRMSPKMKLEIIYEILGCYVEEPKSITARPYYKRLQAEIRIAWRHREKGSLVLVLWKISCILLSRQWFYTIRNLIIHKAQHSN